MGPVAVSFWRFAGGVLLLAAGHLVVRRRTAAPAGAPARGRWRHVVTTGVGLAVYQTAYFAAVGYAGLAVRDGGDAGIRADPHRPRVPPPTGERIGRAGAVDHAGAGRAGPPGGGRERQQSLGTGAGGGLRTAAPVRVCRVTLLNRQMGRACTGGSPQATALGGFAVGMVCLLPLALLKGSHPPRATPARGAGPGRLPRVRPDRAGVQPVLRRAGHGPSDHRVGHCADEAGHRHCHRGAAARRAAHGDRHRRLGRAARGRGRARRSGSSGPAAGRRHPVRRNTRRRHAPAEARAVRPGGLGRTRRGQR